MTGFRSTEILPPALYQRVTELRVSDPDRSLRTALRRNRRPKMAPLGKLNLVAADHPARGIVSIGADPIAMADRRDFLSRVLRVLSSDVVDGVMATMDVLEDLLVIHDLILERGGPAILDQKLLIASLNRGGLAGSVWELDDPMTAASPQTCVDWKFDGAKILLRLCLGDAGSLKTLIAAAEAITRMNAHSLPTFLEPLPVVKTEKGLQIQNSRQALASAVSVAAALGDSSRYLWLKLPYCEEYQAVARATSLPILILGGESKGDPAPFLTRIALAMAAGSNVRGAMVGRTVLYPGNRDPLAVAEAVGAIVHRGLSLTQALTIMSGAATTSAPAAHAFPEGR